MHYLIARSLDSESLHQMERIQAVRLSRRILVMGPDHFPPALVKPFTAIVEKGGKEKGRDSLWRVSRLHL